MTRLKRVPVWIVAMVVSVALVSAYAESLSYIRCDCLIGKCQCFIQLGDEGGAVKKIITILIEKNYLPKKTPKGLFSEDVEKAVMEFQSDNGMEATGVMDDSTLTLLLWEKTPEQLDRENPLCRTVYIPTDGGKKHHLNVECSGMSDPRKVSERNAIMLGFDGCKKCTNTR